MIGRTHRFHGYNSLRNVYQRGRTVRAPLVSLRYMARSPQRPYRVAVVVSRKIHKSAVTRNRIRRRVYEAVRGNENQITPGTDLVFTIFSEQLAVLPAAELREIITRLLQKAAAAPAERH